MTNQKQWLSRTQTAKKKATNVTQDASAFEGIVECDEGTLDQVTGGGDTKHTGYGRSANPKGGDRGQRGYAGGIVSNPVYMGLGMHGPD